MTIRVPDTLTGSGGLRPVTAPDPAPDRPGEPDPPSVGGIGEVADPTRGDGGRGWRLRLLGVPLAAALSVAAGSGALSGVLLGTAWVTPVLGGVALVAVLGCAVRLLVAVTAGRSAERSAGSSAGTAPAGAEPERTVRGPGVRVATPLVQLVGLTVWCTALFTAELGGELGGGARLLPGPDELGLLVRGVGIALGQVEGGTPPMPTTPALRLLACLGFGLLAVAVDAAAAAGVAPAACGLELLAAYTVPAALAPRALPPWSLAAGAAGYALVLVTAHRGRQARLRIIDPADPSGGPGAGGVRRWRAAGSGLPVAALITVLAVTVGVVAGLLAPIGTQGRLSGHGSGDNGSASGQFGLSPFTSMRGQLANDEPVELLRVRGLPDDRYLRALTLSRYVPQQGWQLPDRLDGVTLDSSLPSGLPQPVETPTAVVTIQNVGYLDQWLPLIGQPMGVAGVVSGRWHYDVLSGTAYTESPVREPSWTERAGLPEPTPAELARADPAVDVSPTYLDTDGVDPRIVALSKAVTKQGRSPYERAVALNRWFLDPAFGFRYTLATPPGSKDDQLVDFLTRTRAGYCEQYASAMAVMLRTVGVPARVAVGFSTGHQVADYRSVRTSDAHAWVEAYFTGVGWLPFDPTPLDDGRHAIDPGYVQNAPEIDIKNAAGAPPVTAPPPQPGGPGEAPEPTPSIDPKAPPPVTPPATPPPIPPPAAGSNPIGANGTGDPLRLGGRPGEGNPSPGGGDQGGEGAPTGDGQGGDAQGGGDGQDGGGQNAGDRNDSGGDESDGGGSGFGAVLWVVLLVVGVLVLVLLAVASPALARDACRRYRLGRAARGGPDGAAAAWREVLAEFRDRGSAPEPNVTLRTAARRLARGHEIGEDAIGGLKIVVNALERGWYADDTRPGDRPAADDTGSELVGAVRAIREALDQKGRLPWYARLWPRSVLPSRPLGRRGVASPGERAGWRSSELTDVSR